MHWNKPFPDDWRTGATFVHDWAYLVLVVLTIGHVLQGVRGARAARRHDPRAGAEDWAACPARLAATPPAPTTDAGRPSVQALDRWRRRRCRASDGPAVARSAPPQDARRQARPPPIASIRARRSRSPVATATRSRPGRSTPGGCSMPMARPSAFSAPYPPLFSTSTREREPVLRRRPQRLDRVEAGAVAHAGTRRAAPGSARAQPTAAGRAQPRPPLAPAAKPPTRADRQVVVQGVAVRRRLLHHHGVGAAAAPARVCST